MTPSFLSPVNLIATFLRYCFTSSGLTYQTLSIDSNTTIHFWGPSPQTSKPNPSKPALLLLHGFGPSAIWQWRRQVQFFSPLFRVYVPDLVFFGSSTTKSTARSEIFQATCIAKMMEILGEERFHVVGTSYGGFVAYNLAKIAEERVEKVVVASSGVNMTKSHNEELVKAAGCESIENVMLPATATELKVLMGLAVASRSFKIIPDFFWNDFIHKLYSENRDEKLELLKGITLGRDGNVNISPLKQEVLLIWGDQDQIFPVKMAHALNKIIGGKSKLEIIKGTSHVPQIENAPRFNQIVKDFLCDSSE